MAYLKDQSGTYTYISENDRNENYEGNIPYESFVFLYVFVFIQFHSGLCSF